MPDTAEAGSIDLTIYPEESTEAAIRTIAPGMAPLLLIEPTGRDDGTVGFEVILSQIDLPEAVAVFRWIADSLAEHEDD